MNIQSFFACALLTLSSAPHAAASTNLFRTLGTKIHQKVFGTLPAEKIFTLKNGSTLRISPLSIFTPRKEEIELLKRACIPQEIETISARLMLTWLHAKLEDKNGNPALCAGAAIYFKPTKDIVSLCYLATAPEAEKLGIATTLIDYMAEATQCRKMMLHSKESSLSFYVRHGFQLVSFHDLLLTKSFNISSSCVKPRPYSSIKIGRV